MDPEAPSKTLERDLGRGILGQEFEDLPVVFPKVERGRFDMCSAVRHHRRLLRTSAADKSASVRIERAKGNRGRDGSLSSRGQGPALDDRTSIDRDGRPREARPEIEVRLVLPARDL